MVQSKLTAHYLFVRISQSSAKHYHGLAKLLYVWAKRIMRGSKNVHYGGGGVGWDGEGEVQGGRSKVLTMFLCFLQSSYIYEVREVQYS